MEIRVHDYKGFKVIEPSGEIDMHTSPELRKELMALIGKKETPLLINCQNVSFIDSSGIATFVEGLKGIMSYEGRFILTGIHERIMEIFIFSKLDRVFEIHKTIEDVFSN